MHSKMFRSVLLSALFISLTSLPSLVRAEQTRGIQAIQENYIRLVTEEEDLSKLIEEIRKDKKMTSDERERKMSLLEGQRRAVAKEAKSERWRLKRSQKNFEKAEGKQEDVDAMTAEINALAASSSAATPERRDEIQKEIVELSDRIKNKKEAIARRTKNYEKRSGGKMPAVGSEATKVAEPSNETEKVTTEKSVTPVEKSSTGIGENSANSVASQADLKSFAECWTESRKAAETSVFAHFPIGKSELTRSGNSKEEDELRDIFDQTVLKSLGDVQKAGDQRISMIEATGYASKIPMRSKKSLDLLSLERGAFAVDNFFTTAAVDKGYTELKTPGFATHVLPARAPIGGPAWNPGEYESLKQNTKVTENDLRAAADRVLASSDFTPVKVEGDVDATMEKLKQCCSANRAALKYQPYQFMELKIYGSKFTPSSPECVVKSRGVATTTAVKATETLVTVPLVPGRAANPNATGAPRPNNTGYKTGRGSGDAGGAKTPTLPDFFQYKK